MYSVANALSRLNSKKKKQCSKQIQSVQSCEYHHNHVCRNGNGAIARILGSRGCDATGHLTLRYFISIILRNFFLIVTRFLDFFTRIFWHASSGLSCFVFLCFIVCLPASVVIAGAVHLRLLTGAFFLGFSIAYVALEGISCKRIQDTLLSTNIVLLFLPFSFKYPQGGQRLSARKSLNASEIQI